MELTDLLDELGVEYRQAGEHHHATSKRIQIDCPHCSPDSKRYRLGISPSSFWCNCWTCGKHPLLQTLSLSAIGIESSRIALFLSRLQKASNVPESDPNASPSTLCIPKDIRELKDCYQHCKYLWSRGFDPEKVSKTWGVKVVGVDRRVGWSLFLPVLDRKKTQVSWTTRKIAEGDGPKYVNAKPSEERKPIKHQLYGEAYVKHGIVVVEGPTDAWRIGRGAVATFGTSVTMQQERKIAQYPIRVVCFDTEPEAQKTAKELVYRLSAFPGKTIRVELDANDPGEASDREVRLIRKLIR